MSDAEIVERVLAGDAGAFAAIVERYGDMALRLAARMTGDAEQAHDIVQEVMVRVWRNLGQWRRGSALGTWIYRIAYNAAISAMRRTPATVPYNERLDAPEEPMDASLELRDATLQRALARLQPDDRALLALFYNDDLAISSIAEVMGLSQSAVKVRLHRVRNKLRLLMVNGRCHCEERTK